MKILFIDHAFHEKTRSSRFFADRLAETHELEWLFVDPEDVEAAEKLHAAKDHDLAVLWQMDYLAPLLLARGVPTVVVPMYDGSASLPDLHWLWMKHARIVNFSRRLHDHVELLGCTSRLVKYYIPAVPPRRRATFNDGLKVMLWQRRPEHGINLRVVEALFGDQLKSVHIHDAPDDKTVDTRPYLEPSFDSYKLTMSKWFESRAHYDAILDQCNVLIAPRRGEGIGMVMLEGIARGMLVVATDSATHDEYICNWVSGVLINPDSVGHAHFGIADQLGEMAWRSAIDGAAAWEATLPDLIEYVATTPRPKACSEINTGAFGLSLARAFRAGVDTYRGFLMANRDVISEMTGTSFIGKIDSSGSYRPNPSPTVGRLGVVGEYPWLEQHRADAARLAEGSLVIEGALRLHDGTAWMLGQSLSLGFRLDPRLGVTRRLRITCRWPPNAEGAFAYAVSLNGATVAISSLALNDTIIELTIPPHALKVDNVLHLMADATSFGYGFQDPIAIGIERIELLE